MNKVDALCDVALETFNALLQETLLLFGDAFQGVGGLLDTVGLWDVSHCIYHEYRCVLTPSSTGTEKKSHPVFSAMASPPGTPGR